MKLEDVINAWNAQADEYNHWQNLGSDEAVEFALSMLKERIRSMVDDLVTAYHKPNESAKSVDHAIYHIVEELR